MRTLAEIDAEIADQCIKLCDAEDHRYCERGKRLRREIRLLRIERDEIPPQRQP